MNRSRIGSVAVLLLIGLACLALGGWLRVISAPEWMAPDSSEQSPTMRPWMVEADCYSQLARVQRILEGKGLIQNHFAVENWPEGMVPSTTAPFDYVILLLYAPLTFFTQHPLDWAGALVSPALWVALVVFWMVFRSREFNLAGRALFLIGSAALPAFIWATACGRPRHQSLILALMAVGLTSEYERWHLEISPRRAWTIFAGIIWGLACWTSLFEPAVVVVLLVLFNLIVRRRENPAFLISFGTVMLVAFGLEGAHTLTASVLLLHPPAEYQAALTNWLGTIAEVRPGVSFDPDFLARQVMRTLSLLLLPVVAWVLWSRINFNKTDRFLVLLTAVLMLFTVWQGRWIYYANLAELFLVVRFYQAAPSHWLRLGFLAIFLLGLLNINVLRLQAIAQSPPNQPSVQLAQIARSIDQPGGIMAPWWLSPALLYFSGQPIVSGSSHCGISGIVASAKFFAATSWIDAEKILRERQVRWVVVYDDPGFYYPTLNKAREILGLPPYLEDTPIAEETVAQILIADRFVPTSLHLRGVTPQLKLYEYVPDAGR